MPYTFNNTNVEIYTTSPSVIAGQSIGFCVSTNQTSSEKVFIEVFRSAQFSFSDSQTGTTADLLYRDDYKPRMQVSGLQTAIFCENVDAVVQVIPDEAPINGCNWPVAATWDVPIDQQSSVYIARASFLGTVSYSLFVVRPQTPGLNSKIVCQLSLNTYQAYNPWGGMCFYPNLGGLGQPSTDTVSFQRPCQLWDYILYDQPIVTWLENNGSVEFMTNFELDQSEDALSNYQLFISCGHDEYWSAKMRDRVEEFGNKGGNVLFVSGNTCFRPVSITGSQLTKLAESWVTYGRPEPPTTGLRSSAFNWSAPFPARGFQLRMPEHWAFEGLGLGLNSDLGAASGVIGYETDSAYYIEADGKTVRDVLSPSNLKLLAQAYLDNWVNGHGYADIAAFWRNSGYVLNIGTTAWGQGLRNNVDAPVQLVTANILKMLKYRFGIIYTVNAAGNLVWFRDLNEMTTDTLTGGSTIGSGGWNTFKFLSCDDLGNIYGVTTSGELQYFRDQNRDGTGEVISSEGKVIGQEVWDQFQHVFCGGDGIIYAVRTEGSLMWFRDSHRDGTGQVSGGSVIGASGWNAYKFVFSGGDGIIYGAGNDGNLYWHQDLRRDGTGDVGAGSIIGDAIWNSFQLVFGDSTGNIYAIPANGSLVCFRDVNRDGTGPVQYGRSLAFNGWWSGLASFSGA